MSLMREDMGVLGVFAPNVESKEEGVSPPNEESNERNYRSFKSF